MMLFLMTTWKLIGLVLRTLKRCAILLKSKQRNLGAAIVGAQDYVFLSEDGDKLEDLIDDLLSTDDLPDLGKSKVWKDLLAFT